uniref:FERM, ARHGEF and pleckstrin domain-containing protein 1 n=1 Tax=Hucho hucho TaxID=62062 RepID=A0A4W5P0R2_9TELE
MVEPKPRASAAQRLEAQETLGISTLDPGHRPPTMPPGRHVTIKVCMLDDTEEVFDISQRASGKVLFDLVCAHLNLVEGEYFSLEYQDHKMMVWLDLLKPIVKQLRRPKHTVLRFVVKFFPPDHAQLLEELTRYLFALQIKHDLACGRLTCNDSSAALLVSHIIQSEIGDFEESQSRQHLLNNSYIPDQVALMDKIMEFHSMNKAQTPAESDYQLLEVARRLELYGVRLHPAKDREGSKLSLAVAHTGVLVFQGHTKINAFNWSKVRKLSFKRKRFLIKLRPDLNSSYQDTLEFLMGSRDCCKVFWKICVEYHAFFRLFEEPKARPKPVLFTRGTWALCSVLRTPQSVSGAPGDREEVDSPPHCHWKESVNAEDPSALRIRGSPSIQRNVGHGEDRPGPGAEPGPARQPHPDHLNTGPASRGAKGSSSSIPYIDCSDIDSEYDVAKGRLTLFLIPLSIPSTGVVSNSPHLSASSVNSQGIVNGQKPVELCGPSPDVRQPSPLTSPLLNDAGSVRTDDEDEGRRKRFPTDKAYFIAKELLTTERTYLKDLEVVTSFQDSVGKDEAVPDSLKSTIFTNFDPLYKFQSGFLREVEQRLALWEGCSNAHIKGDYQRIGDVMLKHLQGLKPLTAHLQKHSEALVELEKACRGSRRLEVLVRDFELQKVCYIPLNVFILRPLHRLMHYKQILERLCKHYPPAHVDFRDCRAALADVSEVVSQLHGSMIKMENFQKLLELMKDLIGIDNLVTPGRVSSRRDRTPSQMGPYSLYSALLLTGEFLRLGCLSKLSGKGLQQRMFFLFNDVLLYTSRGMTATNQFKVHGQLPLYGMTIRESEDEWGVPHAFTLVGQRQSVVVAASSSSACVCLHLLSLCVSVLPSLSLSLSLFSLSLFCVSVCLSSVLEEPSPVSDSEASLSVPSSGQGPVPLSLICWYRVHSLSFSDSCRSLENQLSGNLLRKFKNSNGWQKLWVVFTNFSLFFYKTHQDDYPLASLPLLGYSVTIPTETENIHKDYVFKLHFKSHVYYFRSESEYNFERWMEVIRSATVSASHTRIRSRKESHPY